MAKRIYLAPFTEIDAILLTTVIAAHVDARFLKLDLAQGSRIYWPEISGKMMQATGRRWLETECQRLWRYCAYGEDIGQQQGLLPDSDGEDDPVLSAFTRFFLSAFHSLASYHFPPSLYLHANVIPLVPSYSPMLLCVQ
jgi:hypothetical protein